MKNKSFNLPDDTVERLAAEKATTGLSEAHIVRTALDAYWSGSSSGRCLFNSPDSTLIFGCGRLAEGSGLSLAEFIRQVAVVISQIPNSGKDILERLASAVNQFKLLGDLGFPEEEELSIDVAQHLRTCFEEYMSRPKQRKLW